MDEIVYPALLMKKTMTGRAPSGLPSLKVWFMASVTKYPRLRKSDVRSANLRKKLSTLRVFASARSGRLPAGSSPSRMNFLAAGKSVRTLIASGPPKG
jgi:hypothetical protein